MAATVTNAFSDLFYGNPFSTPVGSLIEESTDSIVGAELWQLVSEVCDAINKSATGPKDAVRAIRRRFVTNVTTNETVALHTLFLLESCVKNCGYRFHVVFATRENLREFAKFAVPDAEGVPETVRRRLLSLIQDWTSQFGTHVDFQEFRNIYTELRARGVSFPSPSQARSSSGGPKNTEKISPESQPQSLPIRADPAVVGEESQSSLSVDHGDAEIPATTAPVQTSCKLEKDLAQVRVNICVLSDLIDEAEASETPVTTDVRQLISELFVSLQEMSNRLIQAISCWEAYQEKLPHRGTTDAVLLDMINVNDELHTVLLRYGRVFNNESRMPNQVGDEKPMHSNVKSVVNGDPHDEFSTFVGDQPRNNVGASSAETVANDGVSLVAPSPENPTQDTAKDISLIDF